MHLAKIGGETLFPRLAPLHSSLCVSQSWIISTILSAYCWRFKTVERFCPPTDPTASGAKPFGNGLLLTDQRYSNFLTMSRGEAPLPCIFFLAWSNLVKC